jgi:hypothetical protein
MAHQSDYGRKNYESHGGDIAYDTVAVLQDIPLDIEELGEIIEYAEDYANEERFDELMDAAMYENNMVDMNKDDLIEIIKKTADIVKRMNTEHEKYCLELGKMTDACRTYEK